MGASVGSAQGSVVGSPQVDTDLTGAAGSLAPASGCQSLSTSTSKVRAPSSLSFGFGSRVTGDSAEIEELTGINVNNRNRKLPNPAIIKHRKLGVFRTVNNSKLIWDSRFKPKGILCVHLNIRSIKLNSDQVRHLLTDSNIDLLCLSETWLKETSPSAIISIPGYKMFRKDRQGSKGGGGHDLCQGHF